MTAPETEPTLTHSIPIRDAASELLPAHYETLAYPVVLTFSVLIPGFSSPLECDVSFDPEDGEITIEVEESVSSDGQHGKRSSTATITALCAVDAFSGEVVESNYTFHFYGVSRQVAATPEGEPTPYDDELDSFHEDVAAITPTLEKFFVDVCAALRTRQPEPNSPPTTTDTATE